ncbi:MAG TPA: hypothetical protein VMF67_07700 [Rhizomicrobium sp.]|nr:hypothetical protein [Rhizomicrobium sp.]
MRQRPSHIAFIIIPGKDDPEQRIWREVGAVWPHKEGSGFDIVLHEGVTVHSRIVCTKRRKKQSKRKERGK